MRVNRFVALTTGMSRRAADGVIAEGRVLLNGHPAKLTDQVEETDRLTYNGHTLEVPQQTITIMLNKPSGYVTSRQGQGAATVYSLLPKTYSVLKPIGRLDKYSTGLLLLSNDGELANRLTHPSFDKQKSYNIKLDKPLTPLHQQMISDQGVKLEDGNSKLILEKIDEISAKLWNVRMHEGRNRQIRRTFITLGYTVTKLHRIQFGPYSLGNLRQGSYILVNQMGETIKLF